MPGVCAKARNCPCHRDDRKPARNSANVHRDPTAQQAIANIMRERKRRK